MARLEMGDAERVSLCLASDAWVAPDRFPPGGFLMTGQPPFPVWWVSRPPPFPVVTGWAGGRNARALAQMSSAERVEAAVAALAAALDVDAGRLRQELRGGFSSRLAGRSVRPRRLQLCGRGRQRGGGRARRSDRRDPLLRGRGDRIRRRQRYRPRRHRQRPSGRPTCARPGRSTIARRGGPSRTARREPVSLAENSRHRPYSAAIVTAPDHFFPCAQPFRDGPYVFA